MPGLELAVALVGGIVGGFAAGFIWVAQGQYFAHSAKLYASEVGVAESEANQTLASIFAFTLLSVEVVLKPNPNPNPSPNPHPPPSPSAALRTTRSGWS